MASELNDMAAAATFSMSDFSGATPPSRPLYAAESTFTSSIETSPSLDTSTYLNTYHLPQDLQHQPSASTVDSHIFLEMSAPTDTTPSLSAMIANSASNRSPSETPPSSDVSDRVRKRKRNTEAARRYRQRKVDRLTELEEALAAMTREKDDLRLKLARAEAEVDVLRGMIRK